MPSARRPPARPFRLRNVVLAAAMAASAASPAFVACSAAGDAAATSEAPPASGGGGESATGAGGAAGAAPTGGQGGVLLPTGSGGSSQTTTNIDPDAACASSTEAAELVPLNMLVMFDMSGSMDWDGKWPAATAALVAFVSDPAAAGLRVALRFFPDDGCDEPSCDLAVCSQPLVPIGELTADPAPLDVQEAALVEAIESKSPSGGTPMYAALGGAEQWAYAHLMANPSEKVVVVLVTDGEPTGCIEDISAIAGLAGGAYSTGIYTYAVGLVGSMEAQMNQIAVAGGTGSGIFIGNGNAQAELLAALVQIQKSQIACELVMPEGEEGNPVDPQKVNVLYTPGDGSAQQTLGKVVGPLDCTAQGGWYYDLPADPTKIVLCPATCSIVQSDTFAKIDIVLGCVTKPAG